MFTLNFCRLLLFFLHGAGQIILYRTPDCFYCSNKLLLFFLPSPYGVYVIHIIQRASIVRLGIFHLFKILQRSRTHEPQSIASRKASCAPGRTLMVTTHPFCAKDGDLPKAKTDYRLRKTGAPFRLGIRPSPTVVGRVGAPQCFVVSQRHAFLFFLPSPFGVYVIHIIQRASIVRLGKFHLFKILTLYNRKKAHSIE